MSSIRDPFKTEDSLIKRVKGLYYPKYEVFEALLEDSGIYYKFRSGIIYDIYTLFFHATKYDDMSEYEYDLGFLNHPVLSHKNEYRGRMKFYMENIDYKDVLKSSMYSIINSTIDVLKMLDMANRQGLIATKQVDKNTGNYKYYVKKNQKITVESSNRIERFVNSIISSNAEKEVKSDVLDNINLIDPLEIALPDFKYKLRNGLINIPPRSIKEKGIIILEDTSKSMYKTSSRTISKMIRNIVCLSNKSITYVEYNNSGANVTELNNKKIKSSFIKQPISYCSGRCDLNSIVGNLDLPIGGDILVITDGMDTIDVNDKIIDSKVSINIISQEPCESLVNTCKITNGVTLKIR